MDDRLCLHKCINTTADLLVEYFLHNTNEFENTYLASIAVIKECTNDSEAFKRNIIGQIVQNIDELLSRKVSSFVDVNSCI